MKGLFTRLLPFVPDSVGAIAAFADSPALVIVNDMNGTLSTFHQRVGQPAGSPLTLRSAKDVRELSYAMGAEDDLLRNYRKIIGRLEGTERDFRFVVLVPGPVAATVGVDAARLARRLETELGMPALAVDCTGNRPYDQGISEALLAVFRRVAEKRPAAPEPGRVGVAGLNRLDQQGDAARDAYARLLANLASAEDVTCLDSWDGQPHWERAAACERVVVATSSGLALARAMERAWGTPFARADDLAAGAEGAGVGTGGSPAAAPPAVGLPAVGLPAGALVRPGQRVLIVGEQIEANLLRRAIGGAGPHSGENVRVAWFFAMDAAHQAPGDVRLAGESDLAALAREGVFDAVLADPALRPCLPQGTPLFPFRNLAVGDGPASGTPHAAELRLQASRGDQAPWREGASLQPEPPAWTPAWFKTLREFLAACASSGNAD